MSKTAVMSFADRWLRDVLIARCFCTPRPFAENGRQLIFREISVPNLPGRHQAEHTPNKLGEIFPKQILGRNALTELPIRPKPTGRLITED